MIKTSILWIILLVIAMQSSFASKRSPISISEMEKASALIVIGNISKVVEKSVESHTGIQEVTVEIQSVIKGQTERSSFTITLSYKGVKDFNPQLKNGEIGVFFLKSIDEGVGQLSYFGSLATFPRGDNFKL